MDEFPVNRGLSLNTEKKATDQLMPLCHLPSPLARHWDLFLLYLPYTSWSPAMVLWESTMSCTVSSPLAVTSNVPSDPSPLLYPSPIATLQPWLLAMASPYHQALGKSAPTPFHTKLRWTLPVFSSFELRAVEP